MADNNNQLLYFHMLLLSNIPPHKNVYSVLPTGDLSEGFQLSKMIFLIAVEREKINDGG